MKPVDYSQRAIGQRIRQVSQLRKLCLSLSKAKPVENVPGRTTGDSRKSS